MKNIFFAGLKGGSGKTTLSLLLARYLHFYERKKVKLVSLETIALMGTLSRAMRSQFPVEDIPAGSFTPGKNTGDTDYVVIDCPSTQNQLSVLRAETEGKIIIPFQYHIEDYFKLLYLVKTFSKAGLQKEFILLPNKYNGRFRENSQAKILFDDNELISSLPRLPPITQTSKLLDINFSAPPPETINYIRPAFSLIINNIV